MSSDDRFPFGAAALVLVVVGGCSAVGFAGCPQYKVYSARLDGEAALAEAESSRRIAVLEAKAKQDAASELAKAEVIRAEGVAKANQIIGASLNGNEAYLRYLWIQSLEAGKSEVIYVPTEANLPILEASRKGQQAAPEPTPAAEKK